ncbi:MAG: hypothetical protein CL480_11350 [Acidobacteria bacterium]|nr:hypothetical protein [Acidobacteriota bacterium]|tara:strand:- start:8849 stop:9241 length:393 start_codon:yes stop_codon:yes gene_type:complete
MATPTFRAGGDINPARFVTVSTAARHTVLESNSGDTALIGITDESTKNAPQTGGSTLHAESGDHARVHPYGDDCKLELGGTVTQGDFIKPDNSGMGVTAGAAAVAGAIALESGISGDLIDVMILIYSVPA